MVLWVNLGVRVKDGRTKARHLWTAWLMVKTASTMYRLGTGLDKSEDKVEVDVCEDRHLLDFVLLRVNLMPISNAHAERESTANKACGWADEILSAV
jgi:hypothetical protein